MIRVFDFIGVSSEEEEAMRNALRGAAVKFYETPPANWGSGQPGLWVKEPKEAEKARIALAAAQEKWKKQTGVGSQTLFEPRKGRVVVWLLVVFVTIAILVFLSQPARL